MADPSQPGPSKIATEHALPSSVLYSVEYPGYVRETSMPYALQTLGGQTSIDSAFRKGASKQESLLELNLRPENPFSHPIPGDVVGTHNIVLKVVRRRRRRMNAAGEEEIVGEYTAEAVGTVPKTVRFRSMVDFQFQPDMNDPISKLRMGMANLDVDAVREYSIPPEKEDYVITPDADPANMDIDPALLGDQAPKPISNARLFPPPLFTRQGVTQNYGFKANPMSVQTTVVDEETGEEKKRLVNKMRWKGYGPATAMYQDADVPTKPPANVEEVREQHDQDLLKRLEELFAERPIWTRTAIFNHFTAAEARDIHNSKIILPLSCYVFSDGPWRDTLLQFGYDPRKKPEARFYQRLYFRNLNHPIERASIVSRRQESRTSVASHNRDMKTAAAKGEERNSHVFDGTTVTSETAAFQLCDITDPMLKDMIDDESDLRDTCHERDGWYSSSSLERIKAVLRYKFFSLLEGYVASDEDCEKVLEQLADQRWHPKATARNPRPGKHNMAKGALAPEDVAAMRLRARLDQDVRSMSKQPR